MDRNINFNHHCRIELRIDDKGLSSIFISNPQTLEKAKSLFNDAYDFDHNIYRKQSYITGIISVGDIRLSAFILDTLIANDDRFDIDNIYAFYIKARAFWETWRDNDIDEVRISFPGKKWWSD